VTLSAEVPMSAAMMRWAALVTELDSSRLTIREFAESHGVNPSTLAWWRSRLRNMPRPEASVVAGQFVELRVEAPAAPPLRICLVDRPVVVEVVDGASLDLLRRVVEALC
jgi:hypothetical protein